MEAFEFTLFTDHKPLTLNLFRSSRPWSDRLYLEFTSDIVHIPGSENVVADALSLPSVPDLAVPVFSAVPLDLFALGFDFSSLPTLQSAYPVDVLQPLPISGLHSVSPVLRPL